MPFFSCIRASRIKGLSQLKQIEAHGRRIDEASQKRVDPTRTELNFATTGGLTEDPLALVDAFKALKSKIGAVEGGGKSSIGLHLLAIVSPEWLSETGGDPRDRHNPRVREFQVQAQKWAIDTFGSDAFLGSRLDFDEAGAGVMDLFIVPTTMLKGGRGRSEKRTISVNSALKPIQHKYKKLNSFAGLQDSWAEHAQAKLDQRIERGTPKLISQRDHVYADVFREAAEDIKGQKVAVEASLASATAKEAEAETDRANAARTAAQAAVGLAKVAEKARRLERDQAKVQADRTAVAAREAAVGAKATLVEAELSKASQAARLAAQDRENAAMLRSMAQDQWQRAAAEMAKVQAERDAAIADMRKELYELNIHEELFNNHVIEEDKKLLSKAKSIDEDKKLIEELTSELNKIKKSAEIKDDLASARTDEAEFVIGVNIAPIVGNKESYSFAINTLSCLNKKENKESEKSFNNIKDKGVKELTRRIGERIVEKIETVSKEFLNFIGKWREGDIQIEYSRARADAAQAEFLAMQAKLIAVGEAARKRQAADEAAEAAELAKLTEKYGKFLPLLREREKAKKQVETPSTVKGTGIGE